MFRDADGPSQVIPTLKALAGESAPLSVRRNAGGFVNGVGCHPGMAGTVLVVSFGSFAFGAGFPAAVNPPVLAWVLADDVFQGLGVALGDVAEGVGLGFPVVGVDDVLGADGESKLVVEAARVADHDRDVVLHRQQTDGFVGAGLAAEEIDEQAF